LADFGSLRGVKERQFVSPKPIQAFIATISDHYIGGVLTIPRPKLSRIFPLALGHMSCDLTQGALPILLPFFMSQHHINYTAAATIIFASNLVSTVSQPLLGYLSDRRSRPWLIPLGILLANLGFCCAGIAPSYGLILVAVSVSGLGVATFHPEGARQAHRMAGDKKATIMSLFTLGGQFGFALGPLLATALLLRSGLSGTLYFVLPGLLIATFLFARPHMLSGAKEINVHADASPKPGRGRDDWRSFLCLSGAAVSRSVVFYGLNTFLPLYWLNVLNQSKAVSGTALTILVTASMIGNVLGGRIADRIGYRVAVVIEFALLACFLPFLPFTSSVAVATFLLIPIGILLSAPSSSIVVLGQGYLPNHVGFSAGITMGLAFSFGGIVTPVLGWIADHYGLQAAVMTVAVFPLISTGLALALPRKK